MKGPKTIRPGTYVREFPAFGFGNDGNTGSQHERSKKNAAIFILSGLVLYLILVSMSSIHTLKFPACTVPYEPIVPRSSPPHPMRAWASPRGMPCFLWHPVDSPGTACIVPMDRTSAKPRRVIIPVSVPFPPGTVFRGILSSIPGTAENGTAFYIEYLHYLEGECVEDRGFIDVLTSASDTGRNEWTVMHAPGPATNGGSILVGFPPMAVTLSELVSGPPSICPVECIKVDMGSAVVRIPGSLPALSDTGPGLVVKLPASTAIQRWRTDTFWVTAGARPDIYHIQPNRDRDRKRPSRGIVIPDFPTSRYMNRLFRRIRENEQLDLLEESDDEGVGEGCGGDGSQYLIPNARHKILCRESVRGWIPLVR